MTPEQRYLFDVTGYLHIKGAVTGDALKAAQAAVNARSSGTRANRILWTYKRDRQTRHRV